jgi:hypothetical protein
MTEPTLSRLEQMVRSLMDEKGMELNEACEWLATYRQKEMAEAILELVRGRLQ